MSTGRFILKCLTMLWIYLCIYSSLPVLYRDIYDMDYRRTMNLILAKRFNVPWCGKLCWNIFTLYTSFWFLRKSGIQLYQPYQWPFIVFQHAEKSKQVVVQFLFTSPIFIQLQTLVYRKPGYSDFKTTADTFSALVFRAFNLTLN